MILTDSISQQPLIMALDVGTMSVRAATYTQDGTLVNLAAQSIGLNRISDTEIEQDPHEMRVALFQVMDEVVADAEDRQCQIVTAGLTTQRSSVVAWNHESGEPLSPILSWQDRRAAHYLTALESASSEIKRTSGLFLSPHYGASKLRWLLDCRLDSEARDTLQIGPLASFIVHSIVEGNPQIVDHVNASRTQLMDLSARNWSGPLLKKFCLPRKLLPSCQPTQSDFGVLKHNGIPLTAVNGDQNAAIHGSGAIEPGTCIVNIGTGAFVLLATGNRPIHHPRLLASIANSDAESATYLLEGTVNSAGAALTWAEESWGVENLSMQLGDWLTSVKEPPVFMNTIGGLGSPLWKEGPAPHFIGDGDIPEKAVAIVESFLFLIQLNLDAMKNTGHVIKRIRISGGLAMIDELCQRLADLSERVVVRSAESQSTARGIAWLASNQDKRWDNSEEACFFPAGNRPLQARYRRFCAELGWR